MMATRQSRSGAKANRAPVPPESIPNDLSYNEARTALDLALAQLQASDLDVEAMAGLFQRAQGYARRCEALLEQVEQEVALWNSTAPDEPPQPYQGHQS